MILIKRNIGKKKGKKSVTLRIERQNSKERIMSITIAKTSTYELQDLLERRMLPILEDKINVSAVLQFTYALKQLMKGKDAVRDCNKLIKSFEEEIR